MIRRLQVIEEKRQAMQKEHIAQSHMLDEEIERVVKEYEDGLSMTMTYDVGDKIKRITSAADDALIVEDHLAKWEDGALKDGYLCKGHAQGHDYPIEVWDVDLFEAVK